MPTMRLYWNESLNKAAKLAIPTTWSLLAIDLYCLGYSGGREEIQFPLMIPWWRAHLTMTSVRLASNNQHFRAVFKIFFSFPSAVRKLSMKKFLLIYFHRILSVLLDSRHVSIMHRQSFDETPWRKLIQILWSAESIHTISRQWLDYFQQWNYSTRYSLLEQWHNDAYKAWEWLWW